MKGIIKFYKEQEGFGFIFDENKEDVYFNIKEWKNPSVPCGNDEVEFELKENHKGKYATHITLLKSASKKQDDRITCPQCKKKIIPRIQYLITHPMRAIALTVLTQLSSSKATR